MKLILTGCTGFIGGEVLRESLRNPSIESIVALSRRKLPDLASNPKVRVVVVQDFSTYPESVLQELSDADACIWSIGTYTGDLSVDVEYPLAFANSIARTLSGRTKFRFLFLGGAFTEQDQNKTLWFLQAARRARGLAEAKLMAFPKEAGCEELWETYVVKPGGVMSAASPDILRWLLGENYCIGAGELTATMVDTVVHGSDKRVLDNRTMILRGRDLLRTVR